MRTLDPKSDFDAALGRALCRANLQGRTLLSVPRSGDPDLVFRVSRLAPHHRLEFAIGRTPYVRYAIPTQDGQILVCGAPTRALIFSKVFREFRCDSGLAAVEVRVSGLGLGFSRQISVRAYGTNPCGEVNLGAGQACRLRPDEELTPRLPPRVACECGSAAVGSPQHSSWCPAGRKS